MNAATRGLLVPAGRYCPDDVFRCDRVVVFLVLGMDASQLETLLEQVGLAQLVSEGFRPLFVTDSDESALFRSYGYRFEHVRPHHEWRTFHPADRWCEYLHHRLSSIVEAYQPDVVLLLRPGDDVSCQMLLALGCSTTGTIEVASAPPNADATPRPSSAQVATDGDDGEATDYDRVKRRVRQLVQQVVPRGSTALVISKGDAELVDVPDRTGWHFPGLAVGGAQRGTYAGSHPLDSAHAIANLEAFRELGARYLVVPTTYLWWLDHYQELEAYLSERHRLHAYRAGAGAVYALFGRASTPVRLVMRPAGHSLSQARRGVLDAG